MTANELVDQINAALRTRAHHASPEGYNKDCEVKILNPRRGDEIDEVILSDDDGDIYLLTK